MDAGPATPAARDVLCFQQSDGCVLCEPRAALSSVLPEPARPLVCEPNSPSNCVEFCSALTPDCALPWSKTPGCVFDDELEFRRALFLRDTDDRPEGWIYGRVVDDTGKRIEKARVRAWVMDRSARPTPLADDQTAKDGTFRLRLRRGPWSYTVRVSHPGLATEIVDTFRGERLEEALPASPRTFRLGPESVIRGKVVDAATGDPVEGALVQAARSAEDAVEVGQARTEPDGTFVLRGLEARRYVLRASQFGWRSHGAGSPVTAPATRVTLKLARTQVIRGVIIDATGAPVPNATVAAVLSLPGTATLPILWSTDSDGGFSEDQFAPGTYYLWARRGDLLTYPPAKIDLVGDEPAEVIMALRHKGARVAGEVRTRSGQALSAATRAVLEPSSPLAFPRKAVGELDAAGRFVISGVLPGRYELSVLEGERPLAIVFGPRDVAVPIEPDSAVALPEPVIVRPQMSE